MVKTNKKVACSKKSYVVKLKDLPLCCPANDMIIWNAHPKVYLPIEKEGSAQCPYCLAQYILQHD